MAQSFQQALVNKMNPAPVSTASPEIAPAVTANNNMEARGIHRNRAMLAARAAANGQDMSGGFATNMRGPPQGLAGD